VAVGVKLDAKFGPMVTFGSGGVLVEVMRDLRAMLAPMGADEVRDAVRKSGSWKLLNGYRGSPPSDIESLIDLVVRVGAIAGDLGAACAEGDLNPVRVSDQGAVVLDALFVPSACTALPEPIASASENNASTASSGHF
jgi:acyl-CoA synthetase (NDP forming)